MLSFLSLLIPENLAELMRLQMASMMIYTIYATVVANIRRSRRRDDRIDFHYVLTSAVSGASLPVSLVLLLTPLHPPLINLLSTFPIYLSIAGLVGVYLSLYSLVR